MSCTSFPCSWLLPSFRDVPYAEIANIDFVTHKQKRKRGEDDTMRTPTKALETAAQRTINLFRFHKAQN